MPTEERSPPKAPSRRRSGKLVRLLVVRGFARFMVAMFVAWSVGAWWAIHWLAGTVFLVLTFNYLLTYIVGWFSPSVLGGPLRVQPWQSFVLFANLVALPIGDYVANDGLSWLSGVLALVALGALGSMVAAVVIMNYFQSRLPPGAFFAEPTAAEQPGDPGRGVDAHHRVAS